MALHTELPVYRDTYKLVLEVFVSTKNFPKEYKYSLGRDMERDVLVLMRCISVFVKTPIKSHFRFKARIFNKAFHSICFKRPFFYFIYHIIYLLIIFEFDCIYLPYS